MKPARLTAQLKRQALGLGADLVGVADLAPFSRLKTYPPDLLAPYRRAVSLAVRLPRAIFDDLVDQPTPIYANFYQAANRRLDEIALGVAGFLEDHDYRALPIPASQMIDMTELRGALTHKAVARMAGLGWQGKSLLIITPQYGPRVRLVTVVTDAPLKANRPLANRCGKCDQCQRACPAGAIKGVGTENRYDSRGQALHFAKCRDLLMQNFAKLPKVEVPICGFCIKACPFTR